MTERLEIEKLLQELHRTRVDGQLEPLCRLFADDAHFRIAGSSDGKPIAIAASSIGQIRPWLAMLVKTFRLTDYRLLSMVIDGERAAVQWRVDIRSRITGVLV